MKINKDSLKAKANNLAKVLNVTKNEIYNRFFYDAFISRLAVSPYKNSFVLKGGLYLSAFLGIDLRSTMDIDFYLKRIEMEKDTLLKIVEEIASIDLNDDIEFYVTDYEEIRKEDIYGGFRIGLIGKLSNVRCSLKIDIATGDPIVPSDIAYDYKCLLTGEVLAIRAYSLESVIAEKLETILHKATFNSRSKDFFDLYILSNDLNGKIDIEVLKRAFKETCIYRHFSIQKEEALFIIDRISKDRKMAERWNKYRQNVKYVENVSLPQVISKIESFIEIIFD